VRPYRFDKYENYFIQDFDAAREGGPPADEEADRALDAVCRAIDPREQRLIVASTAFEVVAGLESIADLIEAAKQGRALAPLECRDEGDQPVAEADCLRMLARLDPLGLYHANFVDGCGRKDAEIYCRWLEVWDVTRSLDINLEFKRGGRDPLRIVVKPSFDESSITG
jgi:hypothetical protein